MNAAEVKSVLKLHRVNNLYHANTVVTALTFLNNGGLMSREYVEKNGYPQTIQESDELDKEWDIYNDVFFDSVDIHERIKNVNFYGAVTFEYSLDLLDSLSGYDVLVTKNNPVHWEKGSSLESRYFLDIEELKSGFTKGSFIQHITVKNAEIIPFDYLERIIIENPGEGKEDYLNTALAEIMNVINKNNLRIIPEVRECKNNCKCADTYKSNQEGYTYYRFKTNL